MKDAKPPYQPTVSGPDDTSNFDIDELRPPNNNASSSFSTGASSKESLLNVHLPFVGFTSTISEKIFRSNRINAENNRPSSSALSGIIRDHGSSNVQLQNNYNHVIVNHENNITVIETINESIPLISANDSSSTLLQEETGVLLDSSSSVPSLSVSPQIDPEAVKKLEVDLRLARQEWSEVSAKLGEIRKEKSYLSSQLRSKEEEIEQQLEKNNDLRQQLRNAERIKRQQLEEILELRNDLERERQLRKEGKILRSFQRLCTSFYNDCRVCFLHSVFHVCVMLFFVF